MTARKIDALTREVESNAPFNGKAVSRSAVQWDPENPAKLGKIKDLSVETPLDLRWGNVSQLVWKMVGAPALSQGDLFELEIELRLFGARVTREGLQGVMLQLQHHAAPTQ
jgi:hypothetical protein